MSTKTTRFLIFGLAFAGLIALAILFIDNRRGYQPALEVNFDDDYIARYRGQVAYEVPEVFELANIAIALTEVGRESEYRVFKDTDYCQRVLDHFSPYADHPLLAEINYVENNFTDYYSFRENSLAYVFEDDQIVPGGIFPPGMIWRGDGNDRFTQHLDLVEDFARVSGFRAFYEENKGYYKAESQAYREAADVHHMWDWLETRFDSRYDSYRVVFSPLIYASHSTQRFHDNGMNQTIMFECGPRIYQDTGFSPAVQEGLIAKLLFTEIDHNYVGPVTAKFRDEIETAFSPVSDWNAQENSQLYTSPIGTFDEYMTWGVFLLYAHETYPEDVYDQVADYTVNSMVQGRGFIRFEAFMDELLRLYQAAEDQTIADLYPDILDWAKKN